MPSPFRVTKEVNGCQLERIFFDILENEEDLRIIVEDLRRIIKNPKSNQGNLHVEVWQEPPQNGKAKARQ